MASSARLHAASAAASAGERRRVSRLATARSMVRAMLVPDAAESLLSTSIVSGASR